jgi:guanylate kinase
MKGPLIILSGPSGSGKTVVLRRVLQRGDLPLRVSVSATTRPKRAGEQNGVDYHFWSREVFDREVQEGAFLEWAEVHGRCYGTLRREVDPYLEQGIGVVLVIDVQGAAQVRQQRPDAVSIFLRPPLLEVLEQRLRHRGTESEDAIQRRLEDAEQELARRGEYQYQVVNDDLARAVEEVHEIIRRAFQAPSRREGDGHAG